MELADIWAEIEDDLTWRTDEIRFFQNQLEFIPETKKDQYRRALVLILYAHFEGFCKFAFTLYINVVNKEFIKCSDANCSIVAAAFSSLFQELRNPTIKSDFFRSSLPDDTQLHKFARERNFVEGFQEFENRIVVIPEAIIDTESNLKPVVLRKILFRLGFNHDQFKNIEGQIHELLNYRNRIAHGELKTGIDIDKYNKLSQSSLFIMNEIKTIIMKALSEQRFRKLSNP